MEQSNSLLLNEQALRQCPDQTKPVFVYEWLRYLDRILPVTRKADIKSCQQQLLGQLGARISSGLGPPSRILLARCIAKVFAIADTYDLFQTINICNDYLKATDSNTQIKLTALCVLGTMYEKLGRMVGRSYEETFQILSKWIKIADSNSRTEILKTFSRMVYGLGSAAYSIHKDLYKLLSKNYLTDRVMNVRAAAVRVFADLIAEHGSPIYSYEMDSIGTLCLKALDSSDFQVRLEAANVFANLAVHSIESAGSQRMSSSLPPSSGSAKHHLFTMTDVLQFMSTGFLRGGVSGFLKTGKTVNGVSSGAGHRETRVGIALAYVAMAHKLGVKWLEKNIQLWIHHLLEVVSKCGSLAYTSDSAQLMEAVFMRRCILYVFRNTFGLMLSEQHQIVACKHFGAVLSEHINRFDSVIDAETEDHVLNVSAYCSSEASIVVLLEISALVRQVGTSIRPLFVEASGIMEPVFASLLHPVSATRVAAAWCLRCITLAVPSQSTPLIDRCVNRLEHMKKQSEAISGFSLALAALLAGSRESVLGIPFCKPRQVFAFAEEMIKTAKQSTKLAQKKISAGWLLMSATISMGSSFVRHNIGRILMLWMVSFPLSVEDAQAEKDRGDTFTWECTLESRAGALSSMEVFLRYCPDLATDELVAKLILPIETCLTTLSLIGHLLVLHGAKLRASFHLLRIRPLFRELVADITITDNAQATTVSSLITGICTAVEPCILGGWIKNTSQSYLELGCHPLQTVGYGALEFDALHLVHGTVGGCSLTSSGASIGGLPTDPSSMVVPMSANAVSFPLSTAQSIIVSADEEYNFLWPEPLPMHVASVDTAMQLFGKVFPVLPNKRKLQLLEHLLVCLKAGKPGLARTNSVQLNILGAVCLAMKALGETQPRGARIDDENLQRVCTELVLPFLNSERVLLRCLAIETLGRLAQAVAKPQFVAGNAQYCFDRLRSIHDERTRAGYALSLGCLHRYMGSLGSGQHLSISVSIILALNHSNSPPIVQTWSILSLSLIASTGGGMFRGYVESSLSLCLQLLLSTPSTHVDVLYAIAKLTSALITAVGPELPTTIGKIEHTRTSFLIACSMLYEHSDPQIKAEAIFCLQQLHLFAPRFVQLDRLVVDICNLLFSPHFILRKAAVCCLRQLLQREAQEVRQHAQSLLPAGVIDHAKLKEKPPLPETGLEGALFELLDMESDREIRQYIKECLLFLMHATCGESLNFWLALCKDILASSPNQEIVRSTIVISDSKNSGKVSSDEHGVVKSTSASSISTGNGGGAVTTSATSKDDGDLPFDADDSFQVGAASGRRGGLGTVREKILPRWPTRVFAFEVVQRLMAACDTERAHIDLALAKELQMSSGEGADYLVLHLSDLIRMGFMGATSDNTSLRLCGLNSLQDVIIRFSSVPEPEFPGHVILEQFQAQVGAALRPAFEPETPSHVTATACRVCSTWIGSGVARDLNDLRRVHQLLVSSLTKLHRGSINTQLYNDSAATLEKLSILKAWAEVYIVAVRQQDELDKRTRGQSATRRSDDHCAEDEDFHSGESLLSLVNPELSALVAHWLAALRDSALLSLPPEFDDQMPENGGAFYTPDSAESCREYYRNSWPPILLATSVWLKRNNFDVQAISPVANSTDSGGGCMETFDACDREARFHLMIGMCVESLCNIREYTEAGDRCIQLCLSTLKNLLDCEWTQSALMRDVRLPVEIMNVLHRLILTRDNLQTQRSCAEVVEKVAFAAESALHSISIEDVENGNVDSHHFCGADSGAHSSSVSVRSTDQAEDDICDGEARADDDAPSSRLHVDTHSSLSFAMLEVCMCLLVRQIPQINTALVKSGKASIAPLHFRKYIRLPSESYELIQLAVRLLVRVPLLCSASEAIVILPSVLFLLLGVLRESSRVDADLIEGRAKRSEGGQRGFAQQPHQQGATSLPLAPETTPGNVSMASAVAIAALKSICSTPLSQFRSSIRKESVTSVAAGCVPPAIFDESTDYIYSAWQSVLRSALLSLLNMVSHQDVDAQSQPEPATNVVDPAVVMLAATVMITSGPTRLVAGTTLFDRFCALVRRCLSTGQPMEVQLKALQSINSLFHRRELRSVFVQELGALVFGKIRVYVLPDGDSESLARTELDLPVLDALDDAELALLQEAFRALDTVLAFSRGEKERIFVNLLVRSLCRFLCTNPVQQLPTLAPNVRRMHDFSLQRLNAIGVNHKDVFRAILVACPTIHERISAAAQCAKDETQRAAAATLQQQHQHNQQQQSSGAAKALATTARTPTIKLAMDFSGFANNKTNGKEEVVEETTD